MRGLRGGSIVGMCALLVAGCGAATLEERGHELQVTRAVLYQNGIGYFERRGKLDGDVLRLRVRPDQIRDFLKSLTVVDLGDGRAVSIGLPIEKSRAKLMSDLPEQVRTQGGVLAIAQAFRGARCVVDAEHRAVGRLVGVENLTSDGAGKQDWRITVLGDDGALQQLKVSEVRSLRVLDGTLEVGLRKALDVALDAGAWKPVDVAVRLAGHSPHDLVVSYVVEMPTWKPAYRLVLGKQGKVLVQGWAVVDNVSGDDWNGVQLSLTAGMPLAFTYDLYTPRFPQRPNLQPVDEVAQIPTDAYNAVGGLVAPGGSPAASAAPAPDVEESAGELVGGGGRMRKKSSRRTEPMAPPPPPVSVEALERNFKSLVAGAAVGSLFRYDLDERITVGDRQSALVNLVNTRVPGDDVLLFRVGADSVSPYRAVRFANETGFVLEAGPMAIYRNEGEGGGTFLGEALARRIEKGAGTFVPYALDGRVRVTLDEAQREVGMTLVKMVRGALTVQTKLVTRFQYDVDNGSGEAATLYVRRERRAGWTVVGKEKMIEEGGAYYLPIPLATTGRTHVTVEEETPTQRTVDIFTDLGRQGIALYLSNASADPKVVAQLKEVLTLRDQAARLDEQIQTSNQMREAQAQREKEVRDNIQVLGRASSNEDLKKKLEATLVELETGLNAVTRKLVALSMDRAAARDRLSALLGTLTLDTH